MNNKIAKYVKDGYQNLLKGFGGSNDTRTQTTYQHSPRIGRLWTQLEDLYATNSLAAKVIDIPINDAFREGRTLEIEDIKQKEEIEELYVSIDLKINLALKYADLFGGAVLIVVSSDDELSNPIKDIKQGDLLNIAVVDASQVVPQTLDRNPLSVTYNMPSSYLINGTSVNIHPSRTFYIDGINTTNRERERNNGFGLSKLERISNHLEDAVQTNVSIRNLVEQSNIDVIKINNMNDAVAEGAESVVQSRLEILSQMKSLLNTIAIDANDEYINIAKNFSNLDKIQMNMFSLVAMASDIPVTRLMGSSADGLNATGAGDLTNYYDSVKADVQVRRMKPIYKYLDPIVTTHLFGNDVGFKYEFNSLYQLSEEQISTIQKSEADTHSIYLDRGVITEDAVLVELQKKGQYVDFNAGIPPNAFEV